VTTACCLDRAGFGLAGLALFGVLGHGTLRIFTRRKRRAHGK